MWQAVLPRLWHHMLTFYDDLATVGRHYTSVRAYIDYLLQGVDGRGLLITPGPNYGDWVAPVNQTGRAMASGIPPISAHTGLLINTAQLLEDLEMFVDGAAALGYTEDAKKYSARREELVQRFSAVFYNSTSGVFEDTCGNYTEFTSDARRAPVSQRLVGECLNGTLLQSFDGVTNQGQCCSACSAAGRRCAGWTLRSSSGGQMTCELMTGPLTHQAPGDGGGRDGDSDGGNINANCLSATPNNKTILAGLQTLNSFALMVGAAPSDGAAAVIAAALERDAALTNAMHVTTGLIGTRYILPALSQHGHGETALGLVHQTTIPSWGAMVDFSGPLLDQLGPDCGPACHGGFDPKGSQLKPGTIWESYGRAVTNPLRSSGVCRISRWPWVQVEAGHQRIIRCLLASCVCSRTF